MASHTFDDKEIKWQTLAGLEHFVVSVLDVDERNMIIDVLVKFEAFKPIVLHRHKAHNNSFVIHGEHYLYEANGEIKEIRPLGSYTSSPADETPHRECGGATGAVVLFSIRGTGLLYEVLDDEHQVIGSLYFDDFKAMYEAD